MVLVQNLNKKIEQPTWLWLNKYRTVSQKLRELHPEHYAQTPKIQVR